MRGANEIELTAIGVELNCGWRVYVSGLPPKMPSMSPDTCACALNPVPANVASCQRMYLHERRRRSHKRRRLRNGYRNDADYKSYDVFARDSHGRRPKSVLAVCVCQHGQHGRSDRGHGCGQGLHMTVCQHG